MVSTGQGLLGNNMFAYCGNNPVIAADYNGQWLILVIGAVTGAVVSGAITWLNGGSTDEIIVSATCGAFSGTLAASGVGGLAGQMLVGAVSSAVDSGYQNYNDYLAGTKTADDAVIGTLVDAGMGAMFGAMGFEGTNAMHISDIVSGQTIDAVQTLLVRGIHPKVKAAANATCRVGARYVRSEFTNALIDNTITGAMGCGVSAVIETLY